MITGLGPEHHEHTRSKESGDRTFVSGGGELGALTRAFDWASSELGPIEGWSPALRRTVSLILHNRSPLLLFWGADFIQIYNDALAPIAGDQHPERALGRPARECWPEVWGTIGPMIEAASRGEPAAASDDLLLLIRRRGVLEEAHLKVAFSPVPDESVEGTGIGGVLATVTEITEQVFAQRQLRTLCELSIRTAESKTAKEACVAAAKLLRENAWDVSFALFYLTDEGGREAELVSSAGFGSHEFGGGRSSAVPARIDLGAGAEVLDGSTPRGAVMRPLCSPDRSRPHGALVLGLNPHRPFDAGYRTFVDLLSAQVATAVLNAGARSGAASFGEVLVRILGHDLRNPLGAIITATDLLLRGERNARLLRPIQRIRISADRMLRMTEQIVDFARARIGGGIPLDPASFDLGALAEELVGELEGAAPQLLDLEVAGDTHGAWDRDRLGQLLSNLVGNAMEHGDPDVPIRILIDGSQDERVRLAVSGGGTIPDELVPSLFEPFKAAGQGGRARRSKGLGLGLFIAEQIVLAHKGRIEVQSAPEAGTTFSVWLPRSRAQTDST